MGLGLRVGALSCSSCIRTGEVDTGKESVCLGFRA